MTAGKLYDMGSDLARSSPLPQRVNQLILCANNVSATHRGEFSKRGRWGPRASRLRSKTIERGRHDAFVAIGVEQGSSNVEIRPYRPQLRVGLTQPLVPVRININHVGIVLKLINQASSRVRNHGTQIHQMPHRSPSRDQRSCGAAQRVPHDHHIVVAPIKGSANHISVDACGDRRVAAMVRASGQHNALVV